MEQANPLEVCPLRRPSSQLCTILILGSFSLWVCTPEKRARRQNTRYDNLDRLMGVRGTIPVSRPVFKPSLTGS